MKLRESVQMFAEAMEDQLLKHDDKGGWGARNAAGLASKAISNIENWEAKPADLYWLIHAANHLMMARENAKAKT